MIAGLPEHLLTGIPRIDREHQVLVELIGWIEEVCSIANATNCLGCILSVRDACGSNLEALLTTLRIYMESHFRYEERLMADWAVPRDHADGHRAAHRLMERRFQDLVEEFARERNAAATTRKVAADLHAWLVEHFETYDAELAVYIGPEDRA